jgi:hypothetical protein
MPDRFSGALCRAGFFANHDVTIIDRLLTLAHHAPSVPHLRTVVLIKSDDLLELAAFELDTIMYDKNAFWWQWNDNDNLEGYNKNSDAHVFTWQPHGSQFTIIENVPKHRLAITQVHGFCPNLG